MKKIVLTALVLSLTMTLNGYTTETTLHWWQFWTDPAIKPVINQMVDEFEQQNNGVKVEVTDLTWANGHEKIVLAFSSGKAPDVVELGSDWLAQFAANGHLADWSDDIEKDSAQFQGWGMTEYDGKVFGFPWILGTRVLFANRDLLTKAGYDEHFVPINWSDLKTSAIAIHNLGATIYGWGSNAPEKHRLYKKYLPFFWSANAKIFTDDGKYCVLPSTYAVDALTIYKELHDSCGYVANQRGIEDAFLDGKIGYIISGDWLLKRIELEKRDINLVSTLIPGPKYPGRSFLGGEILTVNEASEHKELARRFIRFITSPENQVRFCRANRSANPSSRVAQEDEYFTSNPHLQTFIKQIRTAKHPPVDPDWIYIEDAIEKAVEDALFGSGKVAEPLRKAQIKISKLKKK